MGRPGTTHLPGDLGGSVPPGFCLEGPQGFSCLQGVGGSLGPPPARPSGDIKNLQRGLGSCPALRLQRRSLPSGPALGLEEGPMVTPEAPASREPLKRLQVGAWRTQRSGPTPQLVGCWWPLGARTQPWVTSRPPVLTESREPSGRKRTPGPRDVEAGPGSLQRRREQGGFLPHSETEP